MTNSGVPCLRARFWSVVLVISGSDYLLLSLRPLRLRGAIQFLIRVGHIEILELPRIAQIEIRLGVVAEVARAVLQGSPVARRGDEVAEIRLAHLQHVLVREI